LTSSELQMTPSAGDLPRPPEGMASARHTSPEVSLVIKPKRRQQRS
jgi:hypothetical protein